MDGRWIPMGDSGIEYKDIHEAYGFKTVGEMCLESERRSVYNELCKTMCAYWRSNDCF